MKFYVVLLSVIFSGQLFAKDRPPHRIVSLTPAITETLYDLNLGNEIVGTSNLSHWPEDAKKLPKVGSYQRPSIEKILSLKPTIVITQIEGVDRISRRLSKAKIKLLSFDSNRLEDFPRMLRKLGKEFTREDMAEKLTEEWNASFSALPLPFRQVPTVIAVEPSSGIYVGRNTFINDLLERCGGENQIESSGFPNLAREKLSALKVEKILLLSMSGSKSDKMALKAIPAFKNKPIVSLDSNKFSRLSMSLAKHAKEFCDAVVLKQ